MSPSHLARLELDGSVEREGTSFHPLENLTSRPRIPQWSGIGCLSITDLRPTFCWIGGQSKMIIRLIPLSLWS